MTRLYRYAGGALKKGMLCYYSMSLVVSVAAEFSHMKWSLVFMMKFFTASTESTRNVYFCTVYHSVVCYSVCWQIFMEATLFVKHHTSEQ